MSVGRKNETIGDFQNGLFSSYSMHVGRNFISLFRLYDGNPHEILQILFYYVIVN